MPIATPSPPHPHLPPPLGDLSVWQRTTRDHPLLNAGKDEPLPSSADVVVIGSGMCGAVTAHTLLSAKNRPRKVVVLEAREICSGASGRNAGHCRPDASRGFTGYSSFHGPEQAKHILSSEAIVLDRVDAFVKANEIECEWTPRKTYDVCLSEEFKEYSETALRDLRSVGGEPPLTELSPKDAQNETRVESAVAAHRWPAATLNPAKLTLAIHTLNTKLGGYSIYAYAPVHAVIQADDCVSWTVTTNRGSVKAGKVVFATNAYSQAVVPELKDLIIPTRAQALKLTPPPVGLEQFPRIEGSYSLRLLPQHFYSVASRPDNTVVLGTSRGWKGMPASLRQSITNTVDDSSPNKDITTNAYETYCSLLGKGGWNAQGIQDGKAAGFEYAWTGIIGMTPDAVPFIGPIPGKAGQFVAAGFNGHGMARIFLCAPALARYMLEGEWDPAMPTAFLVTEERLARLWKGVKRDEVDATGGDLSKMTI